MKKNLIMMLVVLVVIAGGSFYGGMKYGQGKKANVSGNAGRNFQNLQNMTPEQRQQRMQQGGFRGNGQGNGGFTSGEIISKDDKSVTVKDQSGSTKIILYSSSTTVSKTVDGTASDLKIGQNVMISGDSNSDGSITAKTIQERPAGQMNPGIPSDTKTN